MRSGVDIMPTQEDDTIFEITGAAGLRSIAEIHGRLTAALKSAQSLVINLAGADDCDITLIQLIEAARRYADANGKRLALAAPAAGEIAAQLDRGGFVVRPADRSFWLHTAEAAR